MLITFLGRRETPQLIYMTSIMRTSSRLKWSRDARGVVVAFGVWLSLCMGLFAQGVNSPSLGSQGKVYRISPGDFIHIKVYQEDDLETKVRISADGTATFPLLGNIRLGAKTIEEATSLVRQDLARDYLVNPQVTMVVLEYSKKRFTVLGLVQKPGSFEIPSEETVFFPQAIALAGGFHRIAKKSKVSITRQEGGRATTIYIDATSKGGGTGDPQNFQILPGDTITVEEGLF